MTHPDPLRRSLGADLRALRRARGLTLQHLADRLDRSVGWLSQVERGLSNPSITDLRHLAAALDVPVSLLAVHDAVPEEAGRIVRQGRRRGLGSKGSGQVEELLSPDLTDDYEMVHCVFEPGARIGETVRRPTTETGYVVAGRLDLTISGQRFQLSQGDSFRIRDEPFRWANPHDIPAEVIWVISPPVY